MFETMARLSKAIGASALFLVMAIVFVSVIARYLFGYVIPDAYDLPRMFLGILIFWGIALAVAEGTMIKVDFVYENLGPRGRRFLDFLSSVIVLIVVAVIGWRAGVAVLDSFQNGVSTSDWRLKLWPFQLLAALAMIVCIVISARLAWNSLFGRFENHQSTDKEQK